MHWEGDHMRSAGLGPGLRHGRVYWLRHALRAWWCQLPGTDQLVERRGFLLRLRTKLRLQHTDALLVLARRRRMLPCERVKAHQRAVCRLVEGVKCNPAPGILDRIAVGAGALMRLHQLLQHLAVELAQALVLEELPLVECRAVGQR